MKAKTKEDFLREIEEAKDKLRQAGVNADALPLHTNNQYCGLKNDLVPPYSAPPQPMNTQWKKQRICA